MAVRVGSAASARMLAHPAGSVGLRREIRESGGGDDEDQVTGLMGGEGECGGGG